MFSRRLLQSSIPSLLFLALWIGNTFFWKSAALGLVLIVGFLFLFPERFGRWALPRESAPHRWWMGLWLILSAIMVLGSIIYYLFSFPTPVAYVLLLLVIPVALWLGRRSGSEPFPWHRIWGEMKHRAPSAVFGAAGVILLALYFIWKWLQSAGTLEAIRSPWLVVPSAVFAAFGVAAILTVALLLRGRERTLTIPLVAFLLFTTLSVALFVYPLGYGFDGFIHRATEQYIADHGSITPKPFYYIGQYVLVLFVHHAFGLPIDLVDPWLLPILTAFLLPLAWFFAASHLVERRTAASTLLGLFLIPLAGFIVTTPQGLANLWIILILFASIPFLLEKRRGLLKTIALPVAATLAVHPFAGLPALLYAIFLALRKHRTALWIAAIVGAFLLPGSFFVLSFLNHSPLSLSLNGAAFLQSLPPLPVLEHRFRPILDFVYLYGLNAGWILLALAVGGWWITRKKLHAPLRPIFLALLALAANYLTLKTAFDFSFLIDYERSNYADRLLPLMAFFLTPFSMLGLGRLAEGVRRAPLSVRIFSVVLAGAVLTAAFYFTYPRHNAFEVGHDINTSQWDFETVREIEKNAGGKPYVVLANQAVSAAAIRALGFRYLGDQFFYPIPTGGEFYQYFLKMNDKPERQTALEALETIENHCKEKNGCEAESLQRIYYVVNDYWSRSKNIIPAVKFIADENWDIGSRVFIFRFDR